MNENLISRMFYELLETRHLLSATLHGLVSRGDTLAMLADKTNELESFTQQYHSAARSHTATTSSSTCCVICLLCFVFSTTLGIIIVSFMSVS